MYNAFIFSMNHRIQIAPMMGWTHRHFRILMRLMGGKELLLYSEMVTAQALCHGNVDHLLERSKGEGDVVLQIGSGDPELLAQAMQRSQAYGYSGFNLNAGCPSNRVQGADIGACLMKKPEKVKKLLEVMQQHTDKPVSLKTRLGIDGVDSYQYIKEFVSKVEDSGCQYFIIHARDAWLQGLSPKENRSIPPLRYEYVYQLKQDFPHLHITLNGGLVTESAILEALKHVDAVMIGRSAYQDVPLIHQVCQSNDSYMAAIVKYIDYALSHIHGQQQRMLLAPLLSALTGFKGARGWRRRISESNTTEGMIAVLESIRSDVLAQS
jgi:tRNA-dihydrouridine synthase A